MKMIIHNIIIDMNEVKQSRWFDHWQVNEEIVAQRIMEYLTPLFGEEHTLDNQGEELPSMQVRLPQNSLTTFTTEDGFFIAEFRPTED
jgi:hypothetical protein